MGNFCASCWSSCCANSPMGGTASPAQPILQPSPRGGTGSPAQPILQPPVNSPPAAPSPPPPAPQLTDPKKELQDIINADIIEASQLPQLINYIDRLLLQIKSDQPSTSATTPKTRAPGLLKSVDLKFTSKIMDKISSEIKNIFDKNKGDSMPKEETRRVAKDALQAAGNLHWIAVGFSVLAFVLERMSKVSSNHKESIKLLESMTCLAKRLQDLNDRIPEETESINRGVQTIVEGATTCCYYILKGRAYGWAVAGTMESTLADIRTDIDRVYRDVDYILCMKIVREVGRRSVPDPKKLLDIPPLGVDDQVKAVRELLDVEGNTPALAVIIYGFGGAGKTTLGKAVVESLNLSGYGFATVTMEEQSNICGLQKDIIYALTKEAIEFNSHDLGQTELSKVFKKQPSFIFVDNVVNEQDIRRLLPKNLSEGNQKLRILMTSRRSIVKREFSISCKEHQINTLSAEISKEILRKTIVQSHGIPDPEIQKISDLIDSVAVACGGIPLLLEVYGKYLRNNTDPEEYEAALGSLKKGPKPGLYIEEDLSEILLYVYEKLDEDTKEAFLDICTFFHGWERDLVSSLVGKIHLKRLEEAALAKTNTSEEVIVHDVLKAMGVKKAEDTRLNAPRDLERVLRNENKLKNVKGIWLDDDESTLTLQSQKIDGVEDSLRVLVLGDRIKVHGQCHGTFSKLRFLDIGDMYSFPFPLRDTPT